MTCVIVTFLSQLTHWLHQLTAVGIGKCNHYRKYWVSVKSPEATGWHSDGTGQHPSLRKGINRENTEGKNKRVSHMSKKEQNIINRREKTNEDQFNLEKLPSYKTNYPILLTSHDWNFKKKTLFYWANLWSSLRKPWKGSRKLRWPSEKQRNLENWKASRTCRIDHW